MAEQRQKDDPMASQRALARHVLRRWVTHEDVPDNWAAATERAFDDLHRGMVPMIGTVGFDAMLRRALHLAGQRYPYLGGVTAKSPDSSFHLAGLTIATEDRPVEEVRDGLVDLLAAFFGLLVSFVGERLFRQLMRNIWTNFPPRAGGADTEEKPG